MKKTLLRYAMIIACLFLGMPVSSWAQNPTFTLDTESIDDRDEDDVSFTIKDDKDNEFGFELNYGDLYFNSFKLTDEKTITELVFPSVEQVQAALDTLGDEADWTEIDGFEGWFASDDSEGPTIDFDGYTSLKKVVVPIEYAENDVKFSFENVSDETALDYTITGNYKDEIGFTLPDNISIFSLNQLTGNPTVTLPEMSGIDFKVLDSEVSLNFEASDPKSIYINGGKVVLTGEDFLKTTNPTSVDGISVQNLESFIVEGDTKLNCDDLSIPYWDNRAYGRKFNNLKTIKINSTSEEEITLAGFMFDGWYLFETLELNSSGLTSIPGYCFAQSTATTIVLPPKVTEIGSGAFAKEFIPNGMADADRAAYSSDKTVGRWKDVHVAGNNGVQELKYWENGVEKTGFPPSLKIIYENGFYSHQMYDCHIPNTIEKIGAWALAGLDHTYKPFIFTFDEQENLEDYKRPITLGECALYNAFDKSYYEIRVPQVAAKYFLYYDATADEKTGYIGDDDEMIDGYNIKYAVEDNAVKPYITFTTSTATVTDETSSYYKQTFWLPYTCKPDAKNSSVYNNKVNAYYVGENFVEKNSGYDKVKLSSVTDTIIAANTPVMITSKKTEGQIVTFDLMSTKLSASGITQTIGNGTAPSTTQNWLKAYTTMSDDDKMQEVEAYRYKWNKTQDQSHINFVLNAGVFNILVESGGTPMLKPGKALLSMPKDKYTRTGSNAKGIQMVFEFDDEETTWIREVEAAKKLRL